MKKIAILFIGAATLATVSCKKSKNETNTTAATQPVLTDFVGKIALPVYQDLQSKATVLNTAVNNLNGSPTTANLEAARTAWKDVRSTWENCEGFLIGPVSDDNYDPNMDTWPVDYQQLDSFIANSSTFSTTTVAGLNQSLRGFHPLEYILWGKSGNVAVTALTANEKKYMVALSEDILANCTALNSSWATSGGNFQTKITTAGTGSALYTSRKDAFLALVGGISDICGEVGDGKIKEPFEAYDSTKAESPFSHNSMTDFTNNIKGAQNVYLCSYNGQTGSSLSSYVSSRNLSLDNTIKQQFTAAINALGNVTMNFETAIYLQRTQLQNAMDAIMALQGTMDGDLKTFVITNVKD